MFVENSFNTKAA